VYCMVVTVISIVLALRHATILQQHQGKKEDNII
jgi:hypothetical protein